MREIKFRAWEKDLKKMVYKDELCGYVEYDANPVKVINLMLNGECEYYIFMQCTGLKDVNDREIYEGDIYKTPTGKLGQVFFHVDGGWLVETKEREFSLRKINSQGRGEIIGNIYEHPELLSKEEIEDE